MDRRWVCRSGEVCVRPSATLRPMIELHTVVGVLVIVGGQRLDACNDDRFLDFVEGEVFDGGVGDGLLNVSAGGLPTDAVTTACSTSSLAS